MSVVQVGLKDVSLMSARYTVTYVGVHTPHECYVYGYICWGALFCDA